MAQAGTTKFSEHLIKVGDGEDPEGFVLVCGLTSKSFGITNNFATTMVPDCADEDLPSFEDKSPVSQAMPLSGSGVFASEVKQAFLAWAYDGAAKNMRHYPGDSGTIGDIEYFEGPAYLSIGTSSEKGGKVTADMTFEWASKPTKNLVAA